MITSMATRRERHVEKPISGDVSVDRGLLDRDELLKMLDEAVNRRVTVISTPPGRGKTSLLRAWADRATSLARIAFVSVDTDPRCSKQLARLAKPGPSGVQRHGRFLNSAQGARASSRAQSSDSDGAGSPDRVER